VPPWAARSAPRASDAISVKEVSQRFIRVS
jgi:hypothetical protein